MTNDLGSLSFATSINVDGFQRGSDKLSQIVGTTSTRITSEMGSALDVTTQLEGAMRKLGAAASIGFSMKQAWDFASQIRDVRSEIQSLEISFETLLGNKDAANELFSSIREFAVNTPMQLKDLASAAQMMLSFNISQDKIMPYLKALGDVSMGDAQKFNSLTLAFSQMSSAGKLMGQDLMQMINAGFNPLAVMAEKTGKSISELKDEMSAGKITAEEVQQAFIDATSEGGKFFNMLEKQSKGIAGAMSNLQGAIDDMLNELGEKSEDAFVSAYSGATTLVKNWKAVAEAIGVCVAAYGAYKAVVMTTAAIDTTLNTARYEAEAAELEKILLLKDADKNADIQQAVASGKLSAAKAEAAIALRAEAAAVVDTLKAKAAAAEQDLQSAIATETATRTRYQQSVELVVAKQKEYNAIQKTGDIFQIAVARQDLETASQERNAASTAYAAAQKEVLTKKRELSTAAATAEAAALQLNTASLNTNANADIQMAIASGQMTEAEGRVAIALRAETAAVIENLKAKAAAAEQQLQSAVVEEASAERALLQADNVLKAKEEALEAAKLSGNASEIAAAKTGLETAAAERNAAMSALSAAQEDVRTKSVLASQAATNAETAAAKLSITTKEKSVTALRAEAAIIMDNLKLKAADAQQELQSAIARESSAKKELEQANKVLKSRKEALSAARLSGNATEIAAAKLDLETAAQQRNAAMSAYNAAQQEVKTQSVVAAQAATDAETTAARLNNETKLQSVEILRAEAAAVVDNLKVKSAAAEKELQMALADEASLTEQYQQLTDVLAAKEEALKAAERSGDILAIESAKTDINTAAQQRNAVSSQLAAAQKEVKSKRQIASAAAETAETVATQVNTAAETANATVTNLLTIAKARLMAVTAKLHAVMMAHPYALAAAAVALLVYGIYKLCTAQSEAEKAQQRLNEALLKGNAAADAEVEHFKYLFNQLKKTKEGTEEYKRIRDELNQQYGHLFTNIDIEKAKIEDLEKQYDKLTAAVRRSAKARAMESYIKDEGQKYAEEMGEHFMQARDAIAKIFGEEYAKKNEDLIRQMVSGEVQIPDEFYKQIISKDRRAAVDFAKEVSKGRNRTELWQKSIEEAEYKFGDYSEPEEQTQQAKTYKEAYEEAEKAWNEAEQKLKEMESARDKFSEEEYRAAADNLKAARERFDKLGGNTKKDTKNTDTTQLVEALNTANEKLNETDRKQKRERQRFAEDMERDIWQARINSGEYGAETYLQQRELNFQKEQSQLQRQMEDAIENEISRQKEIWDAKEEIAEKEAKRDGRTYTKKTFDTEVVSNVTFTPGLTFEDEKMGDVDMSDIYKITEQYKQIQKLILQSQENTRQEEVKRQTSAMNEYLAQWGDYLEKRQALVDIANAKLNDSSANLTEGERMGITAQLEKDLAELDMEASKKTNAISKLFADMSDKSVKELKDLATEGHEALRMLTKDTKYNEDLGKKLGITKEMWELWRKSPEELDKIRKALKDISDTADKMESHLRRTKKALEDIFNAGNDKKKLIDGLEDLSKTIGEITQGLNVLQKAFSSLDDAFGSDLMKGVADGLNGAMDAISSAMSGAQAGAVFGPWGAAAGAATGMVGSLASSLAKLHDAKHEKAIKKLQDQADALKKSYNLLGKSIEKSYSKDASHLIDEQNKMLEQQKVLIKQQIEEEESKKKTDNDRINQWKEQLEEINRTIEENKEKAVDAVFGEDLKNAIDDFASAYANAWAANENRTKAAKNVVRDMMRQMVEESIKAAIQSSSAMERIRQKLEEFYSNNILEDWEQQAIYKMAEDLQKELDDKFSWANSLMNDKNFQQSGSSGGFQAMSEDTASELNGRFTAMVVGQERISDGIESLHNSVISGFAEVRFGMEELQNINLLQLHQLENISKNTKALNDTNDLLERIERNTKNL